MMLRYAFLPHASDAEFEAYGATAAEAFANAALAVASLMWDWEIVAPARRLPVRLEGRDREQVLVKLLDEVVYLLETRGFLLRGVEGASLEESAGGRWAFSASLTGDDRPDRYEVHGRVKAATHHDLRIDEAPGRATVRAVVDV